VTFDKDAHKYWYRGNELSGVTRKVSAKTGYGKMTPEFADYLEEVRITGNVVHDSIQEYIDSGRKQWDSIHAGAIWTRQTVDELYNGHLFAGIQSETLVSDFKHYASAVDIVLLHRDGWLSLMDIKRTFKREYVAAQLSIYKFFIEKWAKPKTYKVKELLCISTKDRRVYPLEYIGDKEVNKILYG
jgi:hypothetical protein